MERAILKGDALPIRCIATRVVLSAMSGPALCAEKSWLLLVVRIMMPLAWGFEPSLGCDTWENAGRRVSAKIKKLSLFFNVIRERIKLAYKPAIKLDVAQFGCWWAKSYVNSMPKDPIPVAIPRGMN